MTLLKSKIEKNPSLRWILIFTNWFYQGISQADLTERIYKILFTLFFWILFWFMMDQPESKSGLYLFLSFVLSHTFNWIINCNLMVIFVHRMKWLHTDPIVLIDHLNSIKKNLQNKDSILFSLSTGGICRGTLNKYSDIDVNIVRKLGFVNAMKNIVQSIYEKKRADFKGIPLDFLISDSPADCKFKTGTYENPVILFDPDNMIPKFYKNKLTLEEAKILNKVY